MASAALHGALWFLLHWAGSAVLSAPGDPTPPLHWVDVARIVAMPGAGTDVLAGPDGAEGGARSGPASLPPASPGEQDSPEVPRPEPATESGSAEPEARHPDPPQPSEERGPDSEIPTVDRITSGVPVQRPSRARGQDEERAAALRRLALEHLVESGAVEPGSPGFTPSDAPPGAGGDFVGLGHRLGTMVDPEILLWQHEVQRRMMHAFHPLPALAREHPGLMARVHIAIDPVTGTIESSRITGTSGIGAFDAAALRAVETVGILPPPPERWRETVAAGVELRFTHPR